VAGHAAMHRRGPRGRGGGVIVNPLRAAKSPACRTRSARFWSGDISVGHFPSEKPGVARMWAMLDIHASWSRALCWGPSGSSRKRSVASRSGTSKPSSTKDSGTRGHDTGAARAAGDASATARAGRGVVGGLRTDRGWIRR
jgi:hypothetical protein